MRHGVAKDRTVSAQDPDMWHGHKSAHRLFDGYKGAMAADTDSGVISAVDVVPASAHAGDTALGLVEATQANTGVEVAETIGDAAFGDVTTRRDFAAAGRRLIAKVPRPARTGKIPKTDFVIDMEVEARRASAPPIQEDAVSRQRNQYH